MDLIGWLGSNNTTKIGMLPSASKYVSIKFADQCLHNNSSKEILNGLKGRSKLKRDNIFVQAWQLHGILLMTATPEPNFRSDI